MIGFPGMQDLFSMIKALQSMIVQAMQLLRLVLMLSQESAGVTRSPFHRRSSGPHSVSCASLGRARKDLVYRTSSIVVPFDTEQVCYLHERLQGSEI